MDPTSSTAPSAFAYGANDPSLSKALLISFPSLCLEAERGRDFTSLFSAKQSRFPRRSYCVGKAASQEVVQSHAGFFVDGLPEGTGTGLGAEGFSESKSEESCHVIPRLTGESELWLVLHVVETVRKRIHQLPATLEFMLVFVSVFVCLGPLLRFSLSADVCCLIQESPSRALVLVSCFFEELIRHCSCYDFLVTVSFFFEV